MSDCSMDQRLGGGEETKEKDLLIPVIFPRMSSKPQVGACAN